MNAQIVVMVADHQALTTGLFWIVLVIGVAVIATFAIIAIKYWL